MKNVLKVIIHSKNGKIPKLELQCNPKLLVFVKFSNKSYEEQYSIYLCLLAFKTGKELHIAMNETFILPFILCHDEKLLQLTPLR